MAAGPATRPVVTDKLSRPDRADAPSPGPDHGAFRRLPVSLNSGPARAGAVPSRPARGRRAGTASAARPH